MGLHMSAQRRESRQTSIQSHAQGRHLAKNHAGTVRLGGGKKEGQLLAGPILSHQSPARPQEGDHGSREGATILGEREYMFQDGKGKKVLADTFGRVGSGKDAVYGRKIVVDLPDNKGRATGAFYFTKGRLISLEATVLPASGNFASPDPGRFIDSIAFAPTQTEPGAVELETPQLE
jgi:hypothetical protein